MEYIQLDSTLQHLITGRQAWHYHIVPCKASEGCIELYADSELFQPHHKDELEILFNRPVVIHSRPTEVIRQTLGRYYRETERTTKQTSTLSNIKSDDFLTTLISEAKRMQSSDIHIEIYEELCRIRLRIDGRMLERYRIEKEIYPALINKVKIKANIDIAEKRLPQDGRIIFKEDDCQFDIRVSVLPTLNGEKIVLRLLNKDSANIEIRKLGFTPEQLELFLEGIKKTHGIILISGPTGSGKTTTLYATLKILNKIETNILTIEDPVEYTLEGINQVQLREDIGLTFARALRTFLRQDPDIIMLGEIRDNETAQMAIRAALTGHLVLSTIHTNSAWGIISRLTDMGLSPFLLADTINLCIAQRLIRLLCPHCKEEAPFDATQLPKNFKTTQTPTTRHVAKGCDACYYTGYKGRKAIYEVVPIDPELAEKIKSNNYDINKLKEQHNIRSLADTAYQEFLLGNTTIEEVYPILLNNN
jgi:general secretion pathway protein E/type IV pilus assembly protein PilB